MPRERKRVQALEPRFADDYVILAKSGNREKILDDFMITLCDMLDEMVTEADTYITIGLSRDGAKVNFVLHEGKLASYAAGRDLVDLLGAVSGL